MRPPILASLAAAFIASTALPVQAKSGVNVGVLSCTVEGGVGLILGSSKSASCVFQKSGGGRERYRGRIGKVGIDIGVTGKSYISWAVFAPGKLGRGALAGSYGGASAEASAGLGLGANVLIGGFKKSVALQPLSVQGQTGLNVAVGITSLTLRAR
jgi:hypothetical protein